MISIEVEFDARMDRARRALRRAIDKADEAGSSTSDAILADVAQLDRDQNKLSFSPEGKKSGKKWAALSPDYAAEKRRAIGKKNILTYSGSLRDSLRQRGGTRREFMKGSVIALGTAHRLARYHQEGTKNMPARPPVRKTGEQVEQLKIRIAKSLLLNAMRLVGTGTRLYKDLDTVQRRLKPSPRKS